MATTDKSGAMPSVTPEDMDAALNAAASLAIAKYLSKLPTDIFPISASIFYSSYVLLCQPAKHTLDVKKSTYKKLAKFLRALEKDRLIQIKGINEDIKVIGVDGRHPKVVEQLESTIHASRIIVKEAARPSERTIPFFEYLQFRTDKVYDIKKISKILEKYYEVHDLLDADNHVLVEGALANVVQKFRERDISGSRQPATKVLSLLLANMDPYYILKFGDSGTVKNISRPALRPIRVTPADGNIRITQFEPYRITSQALAEELRRARACTVLIIPSPDNPLTSAVSIKNTNTEVIVDLLLGRGVPREWIVVEQEPSIKESIPVAQKLQLMVDLDAQSKNILKRDDDGDELDSSRNAKLEARKKQSKVNAVRKRRGMPRIPANRTGGPGYGGQGAGAQKAVGQRSQFTSNVKGTS